MSASLVSGDIKPPQHDSPEHDSSSSSAPQHSGAFMLVSDLDCTLVILQFLAYLVYVSGLLLL